MAGLVGTAAVIGLLSPTILPRSSKSKLDASTMNPDCEREAARTKTRAALQRRKSERKGGAIEKIASVFSLSHSRRHSSDGVPSRSPTRCASIVKDKFDKTKRRSFASSESMQLQLPTPRSSCDHPTTTSTPETASTDSNILISTPPVHVPAPTPTPASTPAHTKGPTSSLKSPAPSPASAPVPVQARILASIPESSVLPEASTSAETQRIRQHYQELSNEFLMVVAAVLAVSQIVLLLRLKGVCA